MSEGFLLYQKMVPEKMSFTWIKLTDASKNSCRRLFFELFLVFFEPSTFFDQESSFGIMMVPLIYPVIIQNGEGRHLFHMSVSHICIWSEKTTPFLLRIIDTSK